MKKLNIAIIGLGNIGSYLFKFLNENKKNKTKKITKKKVKQESLNKDKIKLNDNIKEQLKIVDVCSIIDKCDIDEISKFLLNQAKKKKFPDITVRE